MFQLISFEEGSRRDKMSDIDQGMYLLTFTDKVF